MDHALMAAASGMAAQQRSLEITAQNLSNANTPGYRTLRPVFADLMGQANVGGEPGAAAGVQILAARRLETPGNITATGEPYDLALSGPGFFRLQRPDGSELYTRAGHFHPDATGRLVSPESHLLLGEGGPVLMPAGARQVHIGADGNLTATLADGSTQPVGRLSLAAFADPGALAPAGDGLFAATPEAGPPRPAAPGETGLGRVVQGSLEGSSVDLATEMTAMMQAQRLYELNSRVLQAADEMRQMANNLRR